MERSALTPSLHVTDVSASVAFYADVLGFHQTGEWTEDGRLVWAEVTREGPRGAARLWFFSRPIASRPGPALSGVIYLFVGDVDAAAARIGDAARVSWGPEDQPYGLREFAIEDPDGYIICLARDID